MHQKKASRRRRKEFRWQWLVRIVPPVLNTCIRLLGAFLTVRVLDPKRLHTILAHEGPVLFAFWHGRMLLLPFGVQRYLPQPTQVRMLVCEQCESDVVARTAGHFGISVVREPPARGERAAEVPEMTGSPKDGHAGAAAADGPRGPRHRVQRGLIRLARLSGAAIIPVSWSAWPRWVMPRWDRFLMPLPFGRAVFSVGDPIRVPRHLSQEEEESYRSRVQRSLMNITRGADDALDERRYIGFLYYGYNLLLLPLSVLIVPYALKRLLSTGKLREGLQERLGMIPRYRLPCRTAERPLWVHAVSVGEVTATVPFLRAVRTQYPSLPIVVSTITVTGQETARRQIPEADSVIYFPFDYPWIVARALKAINPRLFVHTETEIWPNFLFLLERMGIPSVIVNGRISEQSCRRYGWFRFFFRKVLTPIEVFGMQSRIDCVRAVRIGADPRKVFVTGNMKFDHSGASIPADGLIHLRASMGFPKESRIFVAGSTHAGEEEVVLSAYSRLRDEFKDIKLLIAPRHPERFREVERVVGQTGYRVARRTQLVAHPPPYDTIDIVVLDTIGELARAYALGTIIFVGGSLVRIGGHNLLEPIAYRKAVFFGPHMENAIEIAMALKRAGGGVEVSDGEMLYQEARKLLRDPESCKKIGEIAFGILQEHQGATERNLAILRTFLDP